MANEPKTKTSAKLANAPVPAKKTSASAAIIAPQVVDEQDLAPVPEVGQMAERILDERAADDADADEGHDVGDRHADLLGIDRRQRAERAVGDADGDAADAAERRDAPDARRDRA